MITNNKLEKIKGHTIQPYRKEYVKGGEPLEKMVTKINFEIQESTVLMWKRYNVKQEHKCLVKKSSFPALKYCY